MELNQGSIHVAQYLTKMPPEEAAERKISNRNRQCERAAGTAVVFNIAQAYGDYKHERIYNGAGSGRQVGYHGSTGAVIMQAGSYKRCCHAQSDMEDAEKPTITRSRKTSDTK